MKKVWMLVMCMLLCLPVSAAAGMSVSGGYFLGGYEGFDGLVKGDVTGFMLSAEASLSGPFGVLGYVEVLQGRNFSAIGFDMSDELHGMDLLRCDVLGTYTLPVSFDPGASVKAAFGYSTSQITADATNQYGEPVETEATVRGFLAGAVGEFAPATSLW